MRFDRNSIMSPIGEPVSLVGSNNIFRRPEPIVPPGPPRRPRPRPTPSIRPGGLGDLATIRIGTDTPSTGQKVFKSREEAEADRLGLTVEEYRAQNPRPPKIVVPRGGLVGNRPPFIQQLRPPLLPPPLEDFGFGPGIRRSEDFFRPDDFMMNVSGGRAESNIAPITDPFVPPPQPPGVPLSERTDIFGQGKKYDPANLPEGFSFDRPNEGTFTSVMPRPGFVYAYGPDGQRVEVPSGDTSGIAPVMDPIIEPAPTTPAAVATDVGAVPTLTTPVGAVDPVLQGQRATETLTDPLIRSLYFGTQDSPGFYQQLQQAGANLIGSDVPLQQTAGLTPLELLARQQAVAGIGGFEPFLQQNRDLVNQAIEQSRRAEQLQDPYYTQAEQIYQDTMGAYDPSMTQQFYNPYEDAVVQQTIEDVMKAGEKQDIAARAREISAGAFGGSRARLGAEERRQDLGEGLAKALSGIRQTGFTEAQRTGLGEFARQQAAKRTGAEGLIGIGTGRGRAASSLAQNLAGLGGELTGLGQTQEALRSGQRGELAGFGSTGRGIAETGLGRIYQQQLGQQQRPLGVLGQIGSMLPGYKQTQTQIDSQYGMPTDPTAAGLGAAFSAYGALAPRKGSS